MTLNTETKVGVFFIVGLAILGIITFKVENWGALLKRQSHMTVRFPHASGLTVGSTVAIAGLKVGEIRDIALTEHGVVMQLAIDARYRVRQDAVAAIAWGGLLGNRYIDITLGSHTASFLEDGSEIAAGPSIEITEILNKVDMAATELRNMLKSSNVGSKLTSLMDNLLKISEDISQGKGTVGKLISSDDAYNRVMSIADDLKKTSERISKIIANNDEKINNIIANLDAAVPEARDAFAALKRVGQQVETGKGVLPALINDEQMYKDLKNALARLNASLDNIESVTKNMQEGKGLIGKLTTDQALADDFTQTIKSIRAIAERIEKGDSTVARLTRDKDLYQDLKKLLDDARETLRTVREQVSVGTFASVLLNAF